MSFFPHALYRFKLKKVLNRKLFQRSNSHRYFSLIDKERYKSFATKKLISSYFDNSAQNMLSFFLEKEKLDVKEVDEILKIIENAKGKIK